ncbi:PAS domain S-box protein [Heliobacterium gestii]|uniref:histidine kinase n=1 Tax=Heliomicrobium gestii TaxID=2699 RepID=A0A845L9H8_HELGE|nr:PAS domain-containing sensor histidine kinase [Heliomicrobium gestii]MBM7865664.1 PAS domain S-box-containing protein [Heliomicrobium gestii]MZP41914.1 PAS domain S-box protein [Heliomicrobium gestii]
MNTQICNSNCYIKSLTKNNLSCSPIIDAITDFVFVKDLSGIYLKCNKAFCDFLGLDDNQITGHKNIEFMNKNDALFFNYMDEVVFNNKKEMKYEKWFEANGKKVLIETIKTPFYNENGEIIGLIGVSRDITSHKLLFESLRESEQKLEMFFSQSLYGFFYMMMDTPIRWDDTVDKETVLDYAIHHQRVTKVNDAFLNLYQAKREAVVGKTLGSLFVQDDRDKRNSFRKFLDEGVLHIETAERRVDGSAFFAEGNYQLLYDEAGRITGHFGIQHDITERKQSEEKLLMAKELAEVANIAKTEFLSTMSHELRTPMNGIIGMCELIKDILNTEEQHQYIDIITKSANDLSVIINSILEYAKLESELVHEETMEVNPLNLLTHVMEPIRRMAEEKGIPIYTTITLGDDERFLCAPRLLQRALLELIRNAMKFTHQGRIDVRIANWLDENQNKAIRIEVQDTGIGIGDKDIERIFDHFTQADGSYSRSYGGIGLGLSRVKRYIEHIGGTVGVSSRLGVGSTFWIVIPQQPQLKGENS